MQTDLLIRFEKPGDHPAIEDVITAAFGQKDEAALVAQLHEDGDAVLSLVAETDGHMKGHVLLSTMHAPFKALGLAPISVHPTYQHKGIGSALINRAIDEAKARGYEAIFLLGEPGYYTRFGFDVELAKSFQSPYAGPYFMVLPLGPGFKVSTAEVAYAPAFQQL